MADTFFTLAQLAILNDKNANDWGVSDLFDDAPLLARIAATIATQGTVHKYIKETAAPSVGFRAENTGRQNTTGTDLAVTINLGILDASFTVDKAIADEYKGGADAYLAREARRFLKAAMFKAEKQLINGTKTASGGDSAGFTGWADSTLLDGASDTYVVNAGGTTATTGSSVYLIRTNDDGRDTMAVLGNDGKIIVGAPVVQAVEDTTNGGRFTGYHVPIIGRMGVQQGAVYSVVRIGNLTADSGKGLTDALISTALQKFPASRQPNLIVMGRRSLGQLQASRTSYNQVGKPPEIPQDAFGIPIIVTDGIGATETLLA